MFHLNHRNLEKHCSALVTLCNRMTQCLVQTLLRYRNSHPSSRQTSWSALFHKAPLNSLCLRVAQIQYFSFFYKTSSICCTMLSSFTSSLIYSILIVFSLTFPTFHSSINSNTRFQIPLRIYLYTCNLPFRPPFTGTSHVCSTSYFFFTLNTSPILLTQQR